jgi:Protein of unknown function (DUF3485)
MMAARYCAFLAAIAILLTSGVLYHSLAKDSELLDAAAARVALVPKVIGAWQAQDEATDDRAFEQTGAKGYWTRQYVNQETKASVLVILMCGRTGKMAVHTPEVCYSGAGYELHDQPASCAIQNERSSEVAHFWTAQFTKKAGRLRLYWAWNARGSWEASPAPRWQFRGDPFLYKLYVSRDVSQQSAVAPEADVTAEFLRRFVPELNRTLFPQVVSGEW